MRHAVIPAAFACALCYNAPGQKQHTKDEAIYLSFALQVLKHNVLARVYHFLRESCCQLVVLCGLTHFMFFKFRVLSFKSKHLSQAQLVALLDDLLPFRATIFGASP